MLCNEDFTPTRIRCHEKTTPLSEVVAVQAVGLNRPAFAGVLRGTPSVIGGVTRVSLDVVGSGGDRWTDHASQRKLRGRS